MLDPNFASYVVAAVALTVGFGAPLLNRQTSLQSQHAANRASALIRVIHLVEVNGQGIQNRIFNLLSARQDEPDIRTGSFNPYGPKARAVHKLNLEELAEASALLAAYGSNELDRAYSAWTASLEKIEDAHLASEADYFENTQDPSPENFRLQLDNEATTRAELGRRIRETLKIHRRPTRVPPLWR